MRLALILKYPPQAETVLKCQVVKVDLKVDRACHLLTFATGTAGKLDVLGRDGHTLGVDGAHVLVLKQADLTALQWKRSATITR